MAANLHLDTYFSNLRFGLSHQSHQTRRQLLQLRGNRGILGTDHERSRPIAFHPARASEFPGGNSTSTDTVGKFVAYDASGAVIAGATFTTTLNRTDLILSTDGTLTSNSFNNGTSTDFTVTSGGVTESVHFVIGNNGGQDNIAGTDNAIDILLGINGSDTLSGAGNDDALFGGGNDDTLLSGGNGNDFITGGTGNDTLNGGAGRDILRGGVGGDSMSGGTEADTFVWLAAADSQTQNGQTVYDNIIDFVSGMDKLDLSAIDANTATPGTNDAFLIRTDGTAGANSLWYTTTGTTTTVFGDTDGNLATFEFQAVLLNQDALNLIKPTDFLP